MLFIFRAFVVSVKFFVVMSVGRRGREDIFCNVHIEISVIKVK